MDENRIPRMMRRYEPKGRPLKSWRSETENRCDDDNFVVNYSLALKRAVKFISRLINLINCFCYFMNACEQILCVLRN